MLIGNLSPRYLPITPNQSQVHAFLYPRLGTPTSSRPVPMKTWLTSPHCLLFPSNREHEQDERNRACNQHTNEDVSGSVNPAVKEPGMAILR